MQEAAREQLAGQMAVLRSNLENNDANIGRIRQELAGSESRSGGIESQITEIKERIAELDGSMDRAKQELDRLQTELTAMTSGGGESNLVVCERKGELVSMDINFALTLDRMYKGKLKDGDLDKYSAEDIKKMEALCEERKAYIKDLCDVSDTVAR